MIKNITSQAVSALAKRSKLTLLLPFDTCWKFFVCKIPILPDLDEIVSFLRKIESQNRQILFNFGNLIIALTMRSGEFPAVCE